MFSRLASLLPPRCALCHSPAPASLCTDCRRDLPRSGPACERCAQPLGVAGTCAACLHSPPPWTRCLAALPYAWPVDVALTRLKFSRQLAYAEAFGGLLVELLQDALPGADALCPVPLHRLRHARRGFNQAAELCRPLVRASRLPLVRGVYRVRNTPPQTGLGRRDRRRNLRAAFALRGPLPYRRPLIVDDVMTTGETCRQLARVLLAGGATEVGALVVARAAAPAQGGGAKV